MCASCMDVRGRSGLQVHLVEEYSEARVGADWIEDGQKGQNGYISDYCMQKTRCCQTVQLAHFPHSLP
jgi:hypothetical protein